MKVILTVSNADGTQPEETITDLASFLSANEDDGTMAREIAKAWHDGVRAVFGGGAQPIFELSAYCDQCDGECSSLTHAGARQ